MSTQAHTAQHRESNQDQRWLSQSEAAEYLGVTPRSIRNYAARGYLRAHRVRGSRLIRLDRADLEAMLSPVPTVGTVGSGRIE